MGSLLIMKDPYEAAVKEDWDALIKWYDEDRVHLQSPLNFAKDTAFHMAVYSGRKKPFEDLLEMAEDEPFAQHAYAVKNGYGNTPLHEAAASGNIEVVKLLVTKGYTNLLQVRNDFRGETPLYRAAAYGRKHIVEYLASKVPSQMTPDKKLNEIHRHRITERSGADKVFDVHASILHDAIRGEHFGTAIRLIKLDESLVHLNRKSGKTSLELLASIPSAFKSQYQMNMWTTLLYFCTPLGDNGDQDDDYGGIDDDDDDNVKQGGIQMRSTDLESGQNKEECRKSTCSNICKVAETIYRLIWRAFFRECPIMKELQKAKRKHKSARRLAQMLVEKDTSWLQSVTENSIMKESHEGPPQDEDHEGPPQDKDHGGPPQDKDHEGPPQDKDDEGPPQEKEDNVPSKKMKGLQEQVVDYEQNPLFTAIKNGIVEIVKETLHVHPQAASSVTPTWHTILHVAIRHRQKEIFYRVKKMRIPMIGLVRGIDQFGYTILHHAADMAGATGRTRPGPAYQLQDELKWFQRVKKVMPSHYARLRDKKNRTAQDLFKQSHENQLKEAQEWIKETSQSCSAVAVLVATLVFAAAYTVPGGSNEHGRPILLDSTLFLIFTIMDVISLWSSLTSVVTFLSILTSPFELEDFSHSLPRKLTMGFSLLFFSVGTTMVAFTATVFLTIREDGGRWTKTFTYSAALVPVGIFALMQFPLYVAVADTMRYISKATRKALPCRLLRRLLSKIKSKKH